MASLKVLWRCLVLACIASPAVARVLEILSVPIKLNLDNDDFKIVQFRAFKDDADINQRVADFCAEHTITDCAGLLDVVHAQQRKTSSTANEESNIKSRHLDKYRFVTAYWNINRDSWTSPYTKHRRDYLKYFEIMLHMEIPFIVFIDYRLYDDLLERIRQHRILNVHTTVISIDEEFLSKHMQSWSYIPIQAAIMQTEGYQNVVRQRESIGDPETYSPEYNFINHAKIDFINYSLQHGLTGEAEYVGWIDFGYLRNESEYFPDFKINSYALFNDRINLMTNRTIPPPLVTPEGVRYYNATDILKTAPFMILGGFWFGSRAALLRYYELYHACLQQLHAHNIADDDQHVQLCAFYTEPDLFHIWEQPVVLGMADIGPYALLVLFDEGWLPKTSVVRTFIAANMEAQDRMSAAEAQSYISPSP